LGVGVVPKVARKLSFPSTALTEETSVGCEVNEKFVLVTYRPTPPAERIDVVIRQTRSVRMGEG
jgi:hypothetical protein